MTSVLAAVPRFVPSATLEPLLDDLERLISPTDPDSLWQCEGVFSKAVSDGTFTAFVNDLILRLLVDPRVPPVSMTPLYRGTGFRLGMITIGDAVLAGTGDEVASHAQHLLLATLGPGDLELRIFERPHLEEVDVFDPSLSLTDRGTRTIRPGEVVRVAAAMDVFDIVGSRRPAVLVVLLGPPVYETVTSYDKATLTARRQFAARLTTTRVQTALALLAELDPEITDDLSSAVVSMLAHSAHSVRWAAANALSHFSDTWRAYALDALRDDPHPHVRSAVRRSLDGGNLGT